MRVKKAGKVVVGADFTDSEKRAINMEIQRQLAEYDRKNANEIDALFLWVVHELFGFGPKRLKYIHDNFRPALNALCDRYEMTDRDDDIWLCTHKLKEIGVDIEEWNSAGTKPEIRE